MTQDELVIERNILRSEYDKKVAELNTKYASSNNTVNHGDIVTDHVGSVRVEKILVYGRDEPCCVYRGIELKKNGEPTKRATKRDVYQTNLKKVS